MLLEQNVRVIACGFRRELQENFETSQLLNDQSIARNVDNSSSELCDLTMCSKI